MRFGIWSWITSSIVTLSAPLWAGGVVRPADPTDYLSVLALLQPGDSLQLQAGTYTSGLPLYDLHGTAADPIVIMGPEGPARAVFEGSNSSNTIRLRTASYIELYNLELDGMGRLGDGVKAESQGLYAHHIRIENFYIHGFEVDQQVVGISTVGCPTWDWVIRRNIIDGAGTGMYLGNSPGTNPFIRGLIEYNLIQNTVGYGFQIKHQNERPTVPGIPTEDAVTIIRHNVISKAAGGSSGANARPNLLLGHFPLSGNGSNDWYLVYGNFFHQNPNEALFQAEGNVVLYQNLMVNESGDAVNIQPHNDVPREIRVFQNTIVANGTALRVTGADPSYEQRVVANAIFGGFVLNSGISQDDVLDSYASADSYLNAPFDALGSLDLFPLAGSLVGAPADTTWIEGFVDWNLDFNGTTRDQTHRGAYAGSGSNPGWQPALERKPEFADVCGTFDVADPVGQLDLNDLLFLAAQWSQTSLETLVLAVNCL